MSSGEYDDDLSRQLWDRDPNPVSSVTPAEFERRWKARFRERISDEGSGGWGTPEEIEQAVIDNWEAVSFEEHADMFENDPEGACDEELSCWENDDGGEY